MKPKLCTQAESLLGMPLPPCTHSIGRRLSRRLALFTMAVLSLLLTSTWFGVGMMVRERNQEDLQQRCELLASVLTLEAQTGGEAAVRWRLENDAAMRAHARLEMWRADGSLLYRGEAPGVTGSRHLRQQDFEVRVPPIGAEPAQVMRARYTMDYARDAARGQRWAWQLVAIILVAGALVAMGARWRVRRELTPLNDLARQTRAISPGRLDQRLQLTDPPEELQPWLVQLNALMDRLQRAYVQLESFNADVAHELRTPLATLIGQTELALSRERDAEALRETLTSNLEEMQRLSGLVNDMLFLSQADRGAVARRGQPLGLATLAAQVADYHEATIEDAGLGLRIDGDATLAVDEPLVKRALSNLVGNATRFAEPGSPLVLRIERPSADEVRLSVENRGRAIAPEHLPRLFDRFFRVDTARACGLDCQHHGLGLAIVAAIARMHGGSTWAESADGLTRVGFSLGSGQAAAEAPATPAPAPAPAPSPVGDALPGLGAGVRA